MSSINVKEIFEELIEVNSTEILPICESFKSNINNLQNVCFLPVSIAHAAVDQTAWIERFRRATQKGEPEGTKEEKKVEIERRMEELDNSDNVGWTLTVLDDLVEQEESVRAAITSLFHLSVINLWTIIETLSLDLWIAVVNEHHTTLGKIVVNDKKEQISRTLTNILVENSFEISFKDRIGSIASSAYDFTGTKDISKSFVTLFKTQRTAIETIFKSSELVRVQAMRNALVHNGGIIDEAYCRMTKDNSKLGEHIKINGKEFSELSSCVLSLCSKFIKLVDGATPSA